MALRSQEQHHHEPGVLQVGRGELLAVRIGQAKVRWRACPRSSRPRWHAARRDERQRTTASSPIVSPRSSFDHYLVSRVLYLLEFSVRDRPPVGASAGFPVLSLRFLPRRVPTANYTVRAIAGSFRRRGPDVRGFWTAWQGGSPRVLFARCGFVDHYALESRPTTCEPSPGWTSLCLARPEPRHGPNHPPPVHPTSAAASAAFGLFTIAGTKASGRVLGANDTIRVGVAGIHGRGQSHIDEFAKQLKDRTCRSPI